MIDSTPEAAEIARAAADLENILSLRKSVPFNIYFLRRLTEQSEKLKAKILDLSTKDDEMHDLKVRRNELDGVLKLLDVDEKGCRTILDAVPKGTESEDSETGKS